MQIHHGGKEVKNRGSQDAGMTRSFSIITLYIIKPLAKTGINAHIEFIFVVPLVRKPFFCDVLMRI